MVTVTPSQHLKPKGSVCLSNKAPPHLPFLSLPSHSYLTQRSFHLSPPSTKWMLCCCWDPASQGKSLLLRHWLQNIKYPDPTILPHPPSLNCLFLACCSFSLPLFPQAHKCPGFHFTENTFCRNCCAVHFQGCRITGYIQAFRYTLADQCPTDPPKPAI